MKSNWVFGKTGECVNTSGKYKKIPPDFDVLLSNLIKCVFSGHFIVSSVLKSGLLSHLCMLWLND